MGMNDRVSKKKRSRQSEKKDNQVTWQGFIEVALSNEAVKELEAMDCEVEFPYSDLEQLIEDGYKVTLSGGATGEARRVTLVDNDKESSTAGYAISGWASNTRDAYVSVLYKHRYVMSADWAEFLQAKQTRKYG